MEKLWLDILYLTGCGVQGLTPDAGRVEKMNFEELYRLSCAQSLDVTVYTALAGCAAFRGPVADSWAGRRLQQLGKTARCDVEREAVYAGLEELGAWYVPLKGSVIKDMYPQPVMRQMGDADILFDDSCRDRVRDWFTEQGYSIYEFREGNHDVYYKKPFLNFEMHVSLFGPSAGQAVYTYWADVKKRLVPAAPDSCRYRMTDEDFYLYFLSHGYKHYSLGGTGLRTLLDCWVILGKTGAAMDRAYLDRELEKLGLTAFERALRQLAAAVFDAPASFCPESLPEEQRRMLTYMTESQTYGTREHKVQNKLRKEQTEGTAVSAGTRLQYLKRRLFPGRDYCWGNEKLQKIYANPLRRWLFYIGRIFKALFTNTREIWREFCLALKSK